MKYEKHKFNIFPEMQKEDFERLKSDLQQNGFDNKQPIWLYQDCIIDGWNRQKACDLLSIQPIYKDFIGNENEAINFVMRTNKRRNLNSSQWACIAAEADEIIQAISEQVEKERREKQAETLKNTLSKEVSLTQLIAPNSKQENETRHKIAETFNTNRTYVSEATKLKETKPEVFEQVKSGQKTLTEVKKEIKKEDVLNQIIEKSKTNILPANIKLLEGDFFDKINEIPDNSIDLLNTDPPYKIINNDWDTFENKKTFLEFTEKWLKIAVKKVKTTGRIYISFAQWYQYDFYEILKKNDFFGFVFKQNIIWYYKNNNKPSNKKEYRYNFEPIFYLYGKDAPKLNFTSDTFGESQQNVWEIATPQSNFNEGKFHAAQKPLELYRRIIKTGAFSDSTVLDCFAGSGTTGLICKELNINCILIEKDINNIKIIKGRL